MTVKEMTMGLASMSVEKPSRNFQILFLGCLASVIFISDCLTPLGHGMSSLYILVVIATLPLKHSMSTRIAMVGATVLILLGYWCSSSRVGYETALINRSISTLCVWVTGLMVLNNISANMALQSLKEKFESKDNLQTKELTEKNRVVVNVLPEMELVKKELEDKENSLHLLIDSFPNGMLILDHFGQVVFANKLVGTFFGYSQQELVGQSIEELIPEWFQPELSQSPGDFIHSPSIPAKEIERIFFARRRDRSEFPVEIGLNHIKTQEGFMVLSSVIDITTRKESEAVLKRLNQQLVTQNQELESYAYAVSHDLRAPLRGIHNYADFLLEELSTRISSEQVEYLTGITTAVCEVEKLVSDLLEISRVNIQNSANHVCKVGDLIQKIIQTLNYGDEVHIQTPTEWPAVFGQDHLLRQIFQNLISNGVKFNRSSKKRIELDWQSEGNGILRFFIRDNGIGIPPQYQNKIFQIFERLHTTQEYEGTGIGLAIVKKAVNKLGGELRVESEIGKGSVFSFTVLMGEVHDDDE